MKSYKFILLCIHFYTALCLHFLSFAESCLFLPNFNSSHIFNTPYTSHKKYIFSTPDKHQSELIQFLSQKIIFSKTEFKFFMEHIYNHESYALFLSSNFSHFSQFLQFGKERKKDVDFAIAAIRLFFNKIKLSSFIDANAFETIAKELSVILPEFIKQEINAKEKNNESAFISFKTLLKEYFNTIFYTLLSFFKEQPNEFIDTLTHEVAKSAHIHFSKQMKDIFSLQRYFVRFIEHCIHKLLWNENDINASWNKVNELAIIIDNAHKNELIPDIETKNDIYWSIIARYCSFLKQFPPKNKQIVLDFLQSLNGKEFSLFFLPEQEDFLITKRQYFINCLEFIATSCY